MVLAGIVGLSLMAAAREPDSEDDDTEEPEPVADVPDPEHEERIMKTLRRFRCAQCHQIDGDLDGGEDGPPLPRHEEFAALYTREYFRRKVGDPEGFWPDTGMTYPRNRKPSEEELGLLAEYFYGGGDRRER